jgi:serine/threonine protein kinase
MFADRNCPRCGVQLPSDAPEGLCPVCLVRVGLADPSIAPLGTKAGSSDAPIGGQSLPPVGPASAPTLPPRPLADPQAVRPERLSAGDQFGSYRIVRRLGAGGMGTVFEAEEQPDGRRLALKVLNDSFDSPEARLRFLQEGRLAAAINHPNSVYVYGTEEIADTPVITMELVRGGTLEDRVRTGGPLPVGEAVDAVLQVMAGLEAASAAGVLHRDIKPSNCFVDSDGTVKIGDFGLSISTIARSDSQLVDNGTFAGTPSFASPEQFRGEPLDIRSDIYSVGVTLFYLLTRTAPLQAPDLLRLMVAVLERSAPDVRKARRDVPAELARVISRCLKKSKDERYQTYAELRKGLEPFSSAIPAAARLLPRMLAGSIDFIIPFCCFLSTGPINVCLLYFGSVRRPFVSAIPYCAWLLMASTYFAIPEWLWGASVGKAICRLRVVGLNRQSPTFLRAYARAMFYLMVSGLLEFQTFRLVQDSVELYFVMVFEPLWPLVLFVTARRKNGFAALHDLLTGTRVVAKPERESRRQSPVDGDVLVDNGEETRKIGPYAVLSTLKHGPEQEWFLGYDPRLLRKVWIRESRSTQPPRGKLALISRSTRIRWIAGQTTDTESWDAFEAAPGQPLMNFLGTRRPWRAVRYWVADLADELTAAAVDHTLPDVLGLDRVWITSDGRAKLMDFPTWGAATDALADEDLPVDESRFSRTFLAQVAMSTLEGRVASSEEATSRPINAVLPLHARTLLDGLPEYTDVGQVAAELRPLLSRRTTITRARRLAMVAVCALCPIGLASYMVLAFVLFGGPTDFNVHEFDVELERRALERLATIEHLDDPAAAKERQQLELYVSYYDRNREGHDSYVRAFLTVAEQNRREDIRSRNLDPQAAKAAAEAIDKSIGKSFQPLDEVAVWDPLDRTSLRQRLKSPFVPRVFFNGANDGFIPVMILSIIAALLFRGGARHALGIFVVNERGARASRLRVLLRTLIAWSPVIALQFALPVPDHPWLCWFCVGIFAGGATYSIFTPTRCVQDRIARTWLVSR